MVKSVGCHGIPETHLVYHAQDIAEADVPIVMRVGLNLPRCMDRFEESFSGCRGYPSDHHRSGTGNTLNINSTVSCEYWIGTKGFCDWLVVMVWLSSECHYKLVEISSSTILSVHLIVLVVRMKTVGEIRQWLFFVGHTIIVIRNCYQLSIKSFLLIVDNSFLSTNCWYPSVCNW